MVFARGHAQTLGRERSSDLSTGVQLGAVYRWPEIHEKFSDKFPRRRSQGSLQVRYCIKLKSGKQAGRKSRQGRATR